VTGSGAAPAISSLRHPIIVAAARLGAGRERKRAGLTLLEGPVLTGEAAAAGLGFERLFALEGDETARRIADASGCPLILVTPDVLAKVSTTRQAQSPVAVLAVPADNARPGRRSLVAWGVGDPGNCGTLIRTAAAFGHDYLAGPGAAETWAPKVLRSAAGGHFRTGVGRVATLDELRRGRTLVATVPRGGSEPGPLPAGAAILIGSEPHGLPSEVVDACAISVTIPMAAGSESINAAVAGAIVAFLGAWGPGANLTPP